MARNDIRPYLSSQGGHPRMDIAPLGSGASFVEGEPLVYSSGAVSEAGSDPGSVAGIAAVPASPTAVSNFVRFARAAGTSIQFYPSDDQKFICENFATDGSGTATTPTQANAVGQGAGFILNGSDWYIDTGAGNLLVLIEQVLDSRHNDITDPNLNVGTGSAVVFRFL